MGAHFYRKVFSRGKKLRKMRKKRVKRDFAHCKNGTSGARTEKPNTLFNRNGDPGPKEIFLTIRAPILKLFNTPFKELGAVFWKVITYRDPISL